MQVSLSHEDEIAQRNRAVDVLEGLAASLGSGILCSKDRPVIGVREQLTDLIPAEFDGVSRVFLPVAPRMPSEGMGRFTAYTSRMAPGSAIEHRCLHEADFALKIVVEGSALYDGMTLTAGDWVWIPAACGYSFTALDAGAVVFTALTCVHDAAATDELLASLARVEEVDVLLRSRAGGDFMTSRDSGTCDALVALGEGDWGGERAAGVTHHPLPFAPRMPTAVLPVLDGRFFAWLAEIAPGTLIPRHSHALEQIADIKVVIKGSIRCDDRELTAGDWLWAPAGGSYTFTAGQTGALLLGGWPWN
jgi:glyoxylate utilization-related uncharacterized protein